jgi:hypothetical protein
LRSRHGNAEPRDAGAPIETSAEPAVSQSAPTSMSPSLTRSPRKSGQSIRKPTNLTSLDNSSVILGGDEVTCRSLAVTTGVDQFVQQIRETILAHLPRCRARSSADHQRTGIVTRVYVGNDLPLATRASRDSASTIAMWSLTVAVCAASEAAALSRATARYVMARRGMLTRPLPSPDRDAVCLVGNRPAGLFRIHPAPCR